MNSIRPYPRALLWPVALGAIVPHVDALVVVEMFALLIPFAILFLATLVLFAGSFVSSGISRHHTLMLCFVLPLFLGSQVLSVAGLGAVQRTRCHRLIQTLHSGSALGPKDVSVPAGITVRHTDDQHFVISFSNGFLLTEKYDSETRKWTTYGWND